MNALLTQTLHGQLLAHVGHDELRTPLLNRAQVLLDTVATACEQLQALANGAPVLADGNAKALREESALYWSDLAPGTHLSRYDHAKALRGEDLLHRAQLLAVFGEITEPGRQVLVDLLQSMPAAQPPVAHAVALVTPDAQRMVLPGVVLLQAPVDGRCLLLCPGLAQQLFEFETRTAAGHSLIEYLMGPLGSQLWELLRAGSTETWPPLAFLQSGVKARFGALDEGFLDYGLKAGIAGDLAGQLQTDPLLWTALEQRGERFWRAMPTAIDAALKMAIKADDERQTRLLTFNTITADIATSLVQRKVSNCQSGIQGYIGDDLDGYAHKRYRLIHASWQAARERTEQVIGQLPGEATPLPEDFWTQLDATATTRRGILATSLGSALHHDAQLQVYEGSLDTGAFALVVDVVTRPAARQRVDTATVVAEIGVGDAASSYSLPGAYVIAPQSAWESPAKQCSVLLFMAGEDGGLRAFGSLEQMLACMTDSLADPAFAPLYGRFSDTARAAIVRYLSLVQLPVVTRPISGNWIDAHLEALIDGHRARAASDMDANARTQQRAELVGALRLPAHEIRDVAIERIAEQRRLQAVLEGLPGWLRAAPLEQRTRFASLLNDYNALAGAQERYLDEHLPPIHSFARELLKARLSAALGRALDPLDVRLRLPDSVEVKVVANVPSQVLVPSQARSTLSLVDLALLNIDRQVTLRLKYARLLDGDTDAELKIDGLNVEMLRRMIIDMDVAGRYRDKLVGLFKVDSDDRRGQILLLPYRAALRMEAFTARVRGQLSKGAWNILESALMARTAARLRTDAMDIQLNTVRLNLGEGNDDLASGLVMIQERRSGTCVLYLPKVPEGATFIEGDSPSTVKDALVQRLRSVAMRSWLAALAGLGRENEARKHYLGQAFERSFSGFIKHAAAHYPAWPLAAALLRQREQQLLNDAQWAARSREDVRAAFAQQLSDGAGQLLWSGLYYLPAIGTVLQLYDGWKDATEAVAAFRNGDSALGVRRLASAELNFGFALLLFVPGIAASTVARKALQGRKTSGAVNAVTASKPRLDGFAGHEVAISLVGAKPQRGLDAGTWKHNGMLYLWQDGKVYEVFRRKGELTLRLRRTKDNGYEHPVRRRADGRFVTHIDTGLRAGGGSRRGSGASADESVMAKYLIKPEDRDLMGPALERGGKYALDDYGASWRPTPGDVGITCFKRTRRQLHDDAEQYLKDLEAPARVTLPDLAADISHTGLIKAMYANADGLVIGEAHASSASKRFLIDNFAALKAEGVKTLYFEHLLADFVADDVQTFNRTGVMSAALTTRLKDLDRNHRVAPGQAHTFYQVVLDAQKHGIEVVAIDCAAAWYEKGLRGVDPGARQRMFSYIASRTIDAHQASQGAHKWVALVGNSHSNTQRGTLGLAELNKAIGVRVVEPEAGIAPRLRPDPGIETSFNQGLVKADFLLEVAVPGGGQTGEFLAVPVQVQVSPLVQPRLTHPGSFYIEKVAGQRVIVHLSRDGNIYRTPITKSLGFYSLVRPSWDKVHGRKFWTLQALLDAMNEQNLTHVPALS